MLRTIFPGVVGEQDVATIGPDATVHEAAGLMVERRIGALLVLRNQRLVGIFTERDVLARVVAESRDSTETRVGEVMTRNPDSLPPDSTAAEALEMMSKRGYRHLPIVDGDRVVAVLSLRDLYSAMTVELKQNLEDTESYMFGTGYRWITLGP